MLQWLWSLLFGKTPTPTPTPVPTTPTAGSYIDTFDGANHALAKNFVFQVSATPGPPAQAHSDYPRNASLDGGGHLAMCLLHETVKDPRLTYPVNWTTAALSTQGALERQYGTWQARIFFPLGTGVHPTFALFGTHYSATNRNSWPACGEIDIMELMGAMQGASVHGPGYDWTHGTQIAKPAPFEVRGSWHNYWCRHEPNCITVGVDSTAILTVTPDDLPKGTTWVFNQPMFAYFDLALVPNTPPTVFQTVMLIDTFRYDPLGGS